MLAQCLSTYYYLRYPLKMILFLIFNKCIKLTVAGLDFGHHNFAPFYGCFSPAFLP